MLAVLNSVKSWVRSQPVEREEDEHPYTNPEVVWGVLDIVCVLWTTHSTELCQEGSDELRSVLEKKAAKCLLVLFKHFRQGEINDK